MELVVSMDWHIQRLPAWMQVAFLLNILDLVLGTLASIAQRKLSSQLGYEGLMRKMAFVALLSFAWILLNVVKMHDVAVLFSGGITLMVITYELSSIKRHLVKLGVPRKYLRYIPDDVLRDEQKQASGVVKDAEQ